MPPRAVKKTFALRDFFTASFWRYFLRAGWLFFPAIIFLFLAWLCFWKITQGKDLMIITLEKQDVFGYFIIALLFWAYVTWYSSRIAAKAKHFQQPDEHPIWTTMRVQGPRILAFTCFTIITLAFFQLPWPDTPKLSGTLCYLLLAASLPVYFLVYELCNRLTAGAGISLARKLKSLRRIRLATFILLFLLAVAVIFFKWFWGLVLLLLVMQIGLVLLLVVRRKIIEAKGESFYQQAAGQRNFTPRSSLLRQLRGLLLDQEDRVYFRAFNVIAAIAGFFYLLTVFSVGFAVQIGSFPFTLIGFGVLLGMGNIVATLSVLGRFNFHILLFLLAVIIGYFLEPHYTKLPDKENRPANFSQRQDLQDFFRNWVSDSSRQRNIDSATVYPVYFVMANGGASRSGYWTASVLAKLEDTTQGKFSEHLFCLSGASGGSVGNATFFSILRGKDRLLATDTTRMPCLNAATEYLATDFLTYTLARMLGPDIFRHILPLKGVYDRGAALAHALENAAPKNAFLYDSLSARFSTFVTQKNQNNYRLPILCINTTRMQDGIPGVISNINIAGDWSNKRIDVLSMVAPGKDLKLSSAVVLGASFPYISPAGRINHKPCDTCEVQPNYFVDGGYFDNSGAGIVNEMIIALRQMLNNPTDTILYKFRNKLEFHVLHITNDPIGTSIPSKVSPLTNDLAAPLKTLMGAYGSQTSINDLRLKSYLRTIYNDNNHYVDLNLYGGDSINYSMNWVISEYLLQAMDRRLYKHPPLNRLITKMNAELN